jgi:hypothetical protein
MLALIYGYSSRKLDCVRSGADVNLTSDTKATLAKKGMLLVSCLGSVNTSLLV